MSDAISRLNAALEGRYHIERELGEGGMATVYLAEDLKHERKVALKVLKPELAAVVGAERFLAEIKTTANLQHPHILPLFDSGEADGFVFYVMPYVEGESLGERLEREQQLPVDDAVQIATNIAEGLDYAHSQGVIHRDIKPANILLQAGKPVISDFGIALAVSAGGGHRLTETGLSLGTPHYMSPEQATGDRTVGPATDIYALGCVLYEMLVGEPPYTGSTPQAILGKIIAGSLESVTAQRKSVPINVDAAISKALEKLPADRFRSAEAFGEALTQTDFRGTGAGQTSPHGAARAWRRLAIGGFATAAVFLLLAAWAWLGQGGDSQRPVIRSALEPPPEARVIPNGGFRLSPDGRLLAFIAVDTEGAQTVWIQSLDAEGRPLEGTQGAIHPFWSPDGQDLGFFAGGSLKRIPAAGGAVTILAATSLTQPKGGTWSPEGRIVYVPDYRTGLFEVSASGGELRALTALDVDDGELSHRWPQFLPDGQTLIFLVQTDEYGAADDRSRIEALDADGERHELMRVNSSPTYASPGGLIYWRGGAIYSQELDSREWRVRGNPRLVAEGVGFNSSEWANFSVSTEGTLVYHIGTALPWRLEWRDRTGRLLSVEGREGDYSQPELSHDGRWVAYVEGIATVWVLDLVRGTRTRLTFEESDHYSPTWSPDGDWVAYSADKTEGAGADIYRRRSSGLGERELLYEGVAGELIQDLTWSPDGRWIAFSKSEDVFLLDLQSGQARIGVATPGDDYFASFSPDGRWLAYISDESGRYEVYVVAVSERAGKWLVSRRGGLLPQWSASGDELFFLGLDYELRVATVDIGETPEFGVPEPLFTISTVGSGHRFDVGPDGRILVRTHAASGNAQNFKLILSWPQLLERPDR